MESSVDMSLAHKALLACGILAPLLKVGIDLLAGRMWKNYSFISQSTSELIAAGAPTRSLALPLELVFDVLMIAFAVGIWTLNGENLLLRITLGLVVVNALISFLVSLLIQCESAQKAVPPRARYTLLSWQSVCSPT